MRKFYFLCFALFSLGTSANHLLGGEIYWECTGNGQYIFYMDLYRECAVGSSAFSSTEAISGPQGNISLTRQYQLDISPSCSGGSGLFCGMPGPSGQGAVEYHHYKSSPITLTGSPPPSGWSFNWNACCRPGGVVNTFTGGFRLDSKMYASPSGCNSSPYFVSNPAVGINKFNKTLSVMTQSESAEDSLYYRIVAPLASANSPVVFNAGYSANSPFPSTSTNPSNGPVSIDHNLGLISMDIQAMATGGGYAYGIKVEQWRDNLLLSEVLRDMTTTAKGAIAHTNPPVVSFDSTNFSFAGPSLIETYPGDTIYFELSGADADYNSGANRFQRITFSARGRALDSLWGGIANYSGKPIITPHNQLGYTQTIRNSIVFSWVIAAEHNNGYKTSHDFMFTFNDDHCPLNGITNIPLRIDVISISNIKADTLKICQDDSVNLLGFTKSGTYQWSPSNGLSSTTVSAPMASPASSQYYYLTDPANPGFMDSVYVEVTPRSYFNLAFSSGQLTLTDSANTTTRVWYYNGIPFNYAYDTLTPFGLGDYYVVAKAGSCQFTSDTVSITSGMSFSVTAPNNGGYSGTPAIVTGAIGVTFQVNQNVNVSWVSIPGISDVYGKTGGYDLNLKVYDNTQTEIFNTDVTIARPIDDVLKIGTNLSLMANQDYTVVVSGDTGYAFSLYDNMALPSTPQNVGFTVKALLGGSAGQFPTTPVSYALPISLGIDKTVDLDELGAHTWSIYPNPAKDEIRIAGLNGACSIELVDVNGKVIKTVHLKKDQKEVNLNRGELASGLYFIKVQFDNSTSVKKVLFQ